MCRSRAEGGQRCNGGVAGNARRRIRYAEAGARAALAEGDADSFIRHADAILAHREALDSQGHDQPKVTPIPADQQVRAAQLLATHAHDGVYRRDGRPYIVHPADVAQRLDSAGMPAPVVAAGWLHDVPEDTDYSLQDLRHLGFHERTVGTVANVTHEKGESYKDKTMPRAVKSLDSATVKDADNQSNTSDKLGPTPDQYAKQMERNEKYLDARRQIKARLYDTEDGQRELEKAFASVSSAVA